MDLLVLYIYTHCRHYHLVSCDHLLPFWSSRSLPFLVSPSLSCYEVLPISFNPILSCLNFQEDIYYAWNVSVCFFNCLPYLSCITYRTDSALKFGWFFLSYMASLFIYKFLSVVTHFPPSLYIARINVCSFHI